jgi:hypothetical protein
VFSQLRRGRRSILANFARDASGLLVLPFEHVFSFVIVLKRDNREGLIQVLSNYNQCGKIHCQQCLEKYSEHLEYRTSLVFKWSKHVQIGRMGQG